MGEELNFAKESLVLYIQTIKQLESQLVSNGFAVQPFQEIPSEIQLYQSLKN